MSATVSYATLERIQELKALLIENQTIAEVGVRGLLLGYRGFQEEAHSLQDLWSCFFAPRP